MIGAELRGAGHWWDSENPTGLSHRFGPPCQASVLCQSGVTFRPKRTVILLSALWRAHDMFWGAGRGCCPLRFGGAVEQVVDFLQGGQHQEHANHPD